MTLGDKTARVLRDPKWLPNNRGDYCCAACGRTYCRTHCGCPACGGELRRPALA